MRPGIALFSQRFRGVLASPPGLFVTRGWRTPVPVGKLTSIPAHMRGRQRVHQADTPKIMTAYATAVAEKHLPTTPPGDGFCASLHSMVKNLTGFALPESSYPSLQLVPAVIRPDFANRWEQERPVR